jgi:general secretion pathway protein G
MQLVRRAGALVTAGRARRSARAVGDSEFTNSPTPHLSGFTMIELVVVIALIMIIASMAMVQYRNTVTHAKEATLKDSLFKMREAIDQYYADKNQYPSTLSALASDGYLREIPKDPFTESSTSWQEIPAEPDASNPTAAPGVYDVKSGAQGTALDGTQYADW